LIFLCLIFYMLCKNLLPVLQRFAKHHVIDIFLWMARVIRSCHIEFTINIFNHYIHINIFNRLLSIVEVSKLILQCFVNIYLLFALHWMLHILCIEFTSIITIPTNYAAYCCLSTFFFHTLLLAPPPSLFSHQKERATWYPKILYNKVAHFFYLSQNADSLPIGYFDCHLGSSCL